MFRLMNLFPGPFPENECKNGAGTGVTGDGLLVHPVWVKCTQTLSGIWPAMIGKLVGIKYGDGRGNPVIHCFSLTDVTFMSLLSLVSSKASREKVVTDSFGQTTRHDVQGVNSSSVCRRGRDLFAVGTSGSDFFGCSLFMQTSQPGARRSRSTSQVGNRCSEIAALGVHEMKVPPGSLFQCAPWKEKQKPCLSTGGHIYGFKLQSQALSKCNKMISGQIHRGGDWELLATHIFRMEIPSTLEHAVFWKNFAIPAPFAKTLRKWVPICYLNTE